MDGSSNTGMQDERIRFRTTLARCSAATAAGAFAWILGSVVLGVIDSHADRIADSHPWVNYAFMASIVALVVVVIVALSIDTDGVSIPAAIAITACYAVPAFAPLGWVELLVSLAAATLVSSLVLWRSLGRSDPSYERFDGELGLFGSGALLAFVVAAIAIGSYPSTGGASSSSGGCLAEYPDVCVPDDGSDYDCDSSALHGASTFSVPGADPMGLDANGNGVGCEDP